MNPFFSVGPRAAYVLGTLMTALVVATGSLGISYEDPVTLMVCGMCVVAHAALPGYMRQS